MRKLISTLAVCLITLSQTLSASWFDVEDTSFDVGLGYRQDTLDFHSKIGFEDNSGSGSSSSSFVSGATGDAIHEHDKFKDIDMWQISASGRGAFCDGFYVRACGDYAQVVDGRLHTRYDFVSGSAVGNSTTNQLKINAKADNGYAYDVAIGLGYEFSLCCDQFKIAPVVGYAYNVQRFKSKHFTLGNQSTGGFSDSSSSSDIVVVDGSSSSSSFFSSSDSFSGSGASSGVRNTTRTEWNGGWVGLDMLYNIDCDWNVFGAFEYHFARMNVKFHTRFNEFVNDSTTATTSHYNSDAWGPAFKLGTVYRFDECWSAGVDGSYKYMRASKGKKHNNTGVRLDRVTWQSFVIEAVIAYHY